MKILGSLLILFCSHELKKIMKYRYIGLYPRWGYLYRSQPFNAQNFYRQYLDRTNPREDKPRTGHILDRTNPRQDKSLTRPYPRQRQILDRGSNYKMYPTLNVSTQNVSTQNVSSHKMYPLLNVSTHKMYLTQNIYILT